MLVSGRVTFGWLEETPSVKIGNASSKAWLCFHAFFVHCHVSFFGCVI